MQQRKITCRERRLAVDFRNAEPVVFTGGIEFYVFSDGQFDFNARSSVRDKSLNQIREEWK
jgi:hypothetical protein